MFKRRKTGPKKPAISALSHLFHGIAIEPCEGACEAARALARERFLSEEAPRLPLDGCTRAQRCRCTYRHFSDRRTDVRREADLGLPHRVLLHDQRDGRGRRVTDS